MPKLFGRAVSAADCRSRYLRSVSKPLATSMFTLLFGWGIPGLALAGETDKMATLSITYENDIVAGTDKHYTNGIKVIFVPERDVPTPQWAHNAAKLVPWFPAGGEIRHGYLFGQSIFTASDISLSNPPLDDRPYAGWLYGGVGIGTESGRQLDLLVLSIGVVGPASLAEKGQKLVHQVLGGDMPQGWDTQLVNEPGFVIVTQRSWRVSNRTFGDGGKLDLTSHLGTALGNVFTHGSTGLTVRFGGHLPRDYGPPRIDPGLPGSANFAPVAGSGWYFFTGAEVRLVARNIFLDGNTFRDSRSVDKYPLVGDMQLGFVVDWQTFRFNYTHVFRTREYKTQESSDSFGVFSASFKF